MFQCFHSFNIPHANLKSDSSEQLYLPNTIITFIFDGEVLFSSDCIMSILEVATNFMMKTGFKPHKSLRTLFFKINIFKLLKSIQ